MTSDQNLFDVQAAMDQSYNLAQDHAWNGETKLYERRISEYRKYKAMYDAGVLYAPNF